MHELSLAYSILEIVESERERRGGKRITTIELEVGKLAGIDCNSLCFCIRTLLSHTASPNAEIDIAADIPQARCRKCGSKFVPETWFDSCPACGSHDREIDHGTEFRIRAIRIEK